METYLGIDLGGTAVKGGRIGSGGLEQKEILVLNQEGTSEALFGEICQLIRSLWTDRVRGIGCAVPALIDERHGTIHGLSNLLQLDGFPLRKRLMEAFNLPIQIENDANCFVLGEKVFGCAKEYHDVVGLVTGTGVGAGLLLNGQLYCGTHYGAGEFGMIPYKESCFEAYCGGKFFSREYGTTGEELFNRAAQGDRESLDAFAVYGGHLGELVKLIYYTLDPQIIVIGGSVSKSYRFYREALEKSLDSFYFSHGKNFNLLPSSLADAAIFGAAGLFYHQ